MSHSWPLVSLAEVLTKSEDWTTVDPERTYKEITVRLWGKGVALRREVSGAEITASRRLKVKAGQFILSRIDARNGAFGLVPDSLDSAVVSNDFPVFTPNPSRILPGFLNWMSKTHGFVNICKAASEGTTNRVRLQEERFLAMKIPLPSLLGQQRIVARIEELAAKIEEARSLRQQAIDEAAALLAGASAKLFSPGVGWRTMAVGDFCEPPQYGFTESATEDPVGPRFLRITDIQDGRVDWKSVPYCHCPDPHKYLLKSGDLVFARTGATTGKSFVIRDCPEAVFASYLIRLRVRDTVSVEYLYHYFQSPEYWEQIADEKKGTGQPNLNGSKLERLKIPVAPQRDQHRIVAEMDSLQAKLDVLKHMLTETAAELDAMLPSILDKAFKGELV